MSDENSEFIPADDAQDTLENRVIQFNINDQRIAEAKEEFKDVDAYTDLPAAKKAKTALTKMRTSLAEAHKEEKATALAYGRRCDAEKNRLLELIGEIEDPIKKDIEAIANKAAIEEEERVSKILGKIEMIQAHALDRHDLSFDELTGRLDALLAIEIDDTYQEMAEDAENAKEVGESKLRIAIMNEEARLEEVKKQAAVEAENKELREKLAKSEAAQKIVDDAAAAEQKVKDDARQAELDKQAEEQEAQQKVLDDEKQKLADEQAAKETKEAEDKAAAIAKLQAPDAEKLALYAADIHTLIENRPVLLSDAGNNILLDAVASLIQIEEFIHSKREEL